MRVLVRGVTRQKSTWGQRSICPRAPLGKGRAPQATQKRQQGPQKTAALLLHKSRGSYLEIFFFTFKMWVYRKIAPLLV